MKRVKDQPRHIPVYEHGQSWGLVFYGYPAPAADEYGLARYREIQWCWQAFDRDGRVYASGSSRSMSVSRFQLKRALRKRERERGDALRPLAA